MLFIEKLFSGKKTFSPLGDTVSVAMENRKIFSPNIVNIHIKIVEIMY